MLKPFARLLVVAGMAGATLSAQAADINLQPFATQGDFEAAMQDLTAAFSYKPLQPAEPAGTLGFNLGIVASYTGIENEQAWRNITGEDFDDLGMIALAATKGLPLGIDVGAFIADVPDTNVSLYGAEIRYAFMEGGIATPAVGLRLAHTWVEGVDDLEFDTTSVDVSVSKGFPLVTPYVGAGRVFGTADPQGITTLSEADINENKFYAGVRFSLLLFKATAELDQTGDNTSYNLRLGFGF
nr:hypothetical protein [Oceanococcus sp. HetDA_MAG_MS8]